MRAAIVTGAFPPSQEPVATTVKHLVDEAVRRGHRPLVLAPGLGPASYRGVRIVRTRPNDVATLSRELDAFRPDLVHVADPRLVGPAPLRVARRLGLPTVVSIHSAGSGRVGDWWGSLAAAGADRTLVTCLAAQERLARAGVAADLWRPGVDADLFDPSMRSAPLVDKWSRGGRLVVGHIGPVDKPNVLRRLVAVGRLPGVRLVVVRAGTGADRLRAKVPGAKVLGDITGVDLAHAVASYDVLVQPRKKDLDCHGVRRALASGVPVVGLATGGITDLVADGVNGLLLDPDQPHALCAGVERLRGDPGLRARLAGRARESVAVRTWADAVDELVEVHWAALRTTHLGRTAVAPGGLP